MATLITKNSQTASAVPSAGSLSTGELAVNTADARLYTKHSDGSVKEIKPSTATNVTGTVAVTNGGTGQTSLTSGALLTGNGTSAIGSIAVGTSGQAIISNGSAWVAGTPASSITGARGQVFTSSGTFTIPSGISSVKVTVVGGGGNGGSNGGFCCTTGWGGGGGGGATTIKFLTSLTSGNTLSVTVGGASGTSSVSSGSQSITTISASGGSAGGNFSPPYGGSGGNGGTSMSGGDLNFAGSGGQAGAISASSNATGTGGTSIFSAGNSSGQNYVNQRTFPTGSGTGYGGGGSGGSSAGSSGVVIFEW